MQPKPAIWPRTRFHGEDVLLQKHYVSKRSRRPKGVLAFLALDAGKRVFCYANAAVRKEDQNDEILRFVDYWKERTGHIPEELVFDSRLTTYQNLYQLDQLGMPFIDAATDRTDYYASRFGLQGALRCESAVSDSAYAHWRAHGEI
jgi:hypothetical protein